MKPKYVIAPGFVISQKDGQRHYVGAMALLQLYGVDARECRFYEPTPQWTPSMWRYESEANEGLIWLRPRNDGDYSLPIT